jgi:hypothetical protein
MLRLGIEYYIVIGKENAKGFSLFFGFENLLVF